MLAKKLAVVAAIAAASVCVPAIGPGGVSADGTGPAATATSAFVPLSVPTRVLDTRTAGALGPGQSITVAVTSTSGVVTGGALLPAAGPTVAAVLNVTVVGPAGTGFWTVWPHGSARPLAASIYVDEPAAANDAALALANLVTVPVGPDGTVEIYSQSGGHVVVDMLGSYQAAPAAAAGRLDPLPAPQRILDTRGSAPLGAGSVTSVAVPGGAGASAAVLNVTTVAAHAGYWTFFPAGSPPPLAANLNALHPGHVVANQVIVKLDGGGTFDVFSQNGGELIVDLVGLFTGDSAAGSTDGLFVPLAAPTRFLDTRETALNPLGTDRLLQPRWNVEVPVVGHPSIARTDVAAIAMNVTFVEALSPGYVSVTPSGSVPSTAEARLTATLNADRAGQILSNHSVVAVSPRGFDLFTQSGGHAVADVSGYYIGAAAPAPHAAALPTSSVPAACPGYPVAPVSRIAWGASATSVARGQQRLLDLGFWHTGVDGDYGLTTLQAVMAFQKWAGLPPSGDLDEATAQRLNTTVCRPSPGITGDGIEVDKGRQLMFNVRGGVTRWVLNVSTGGDYEYQARDLKTGGDASGIAHTPVGTFRVYRVSDDPAYFGSLGTLYRPRFIYGGIAVHGYRSVPNFPASHGCIRVTNAAMDMIWATNVMPMGGRVVVHD